MTRSENEEILFDNLVVRLRNEGYEVEVLKFVNYIFARASNYRIKVGIATSHISVSEFIRGRIAASPSLKLYNWRDASMSLPLPIDDCQLKFILKQLKFWGSKEGIYIYKNAITSKYIFQYSPEAYGFK